MYSGLIPYLLSTTIQSILKNRIRNKIIDYLCPVTVRIFSFSIVPFHLIYSPRMREN